MRIGVIVGVVTCAVACGGAGAGPDAGSLDAGSSDAGVGDAGTTDAGVDGGAMSCPPLPSTVTADLTLPSGCTYLVPETVTVGSSTGSAVLTIESGVTLSFASGAYLSVGESAPGGLVVQGTTTAPVVFTSSSTVPTPGAWGGVALGTHILASTSIDGLNVSYAGESDDTLVSGNFLSFSLLVSVANSLLIPISNITLAHNGGSALVFEGAHVGFESTSTAITVSDITASNFPLVIDPNMASTIPATLTIPSGARIDLAGSGTVLATQTWPAFAYDVSQTVAVGGTASPLLTLSPGTVLAFDSAAYLSIGENMNPGGLSAIGTTTAPIVLTSSEVSPTPGAWGGIVFADNTLAGSTLQNVTVSYAGSSSSYTTDIGSVVAASVSAPVLLLLEDVSVEHNQGDGLIMIGPNTGFASSSKDIVVPDFATGGFPIVIDPNGAGTLPTSLTLASGSAIGIMADGLGDYGGTFQVFTTQTWPSLDVPYSIQPGGSAGSTPLSIDGSNSASATLTIAAPNTIQFASGMGLVVDENESGLGQLVAVGTPTAPIVFTSASAAPAAGVWNGIILMVATPNSLTSTTISYCTVAYAGALGYAIEIQGTGTCVDSGATINNVTFKNYLGCGLENFFATDVGSATNNYSQGGSGATGTFCPDTSDCP